jgi:hypothetical protein
MCAHQSDNVPRWGMDLGKLLHGVILNTTAMSDACMPSDSGRAPHPGGDQDAKALLPLGQQPEGVLVRSARPQQSAA